MLYTYPAVLTFLLPEPDSPSGAYFVSFPGLSHCQTAGRTWEEALEMAADVLALCLTYWEEEQIPIPPPPDPAALPLLPQSRIVFFTADTAAYRKKYPPVCPAAT